MGIAPAGAEEFDDQSSDHGHAGETKEAAEGRAPDEWREAGGETGAGALRGERGGRWRGEGRAGRGDGFRFRREVGAGDFDGLRRGFRGFVSRGIRIEITEGESHLFGAALTGHLTETEDGGAAEGGSILGGEIRLAIIGFPIASGFQDRLLEQLEVAFPPDLRRDLLGLAGLPLGWNVGAAEGEFSNCALKAVRAALCGQGADFDAGAVIRFAAQGHFLLNHAGEKPVENRVIGAAALTGAVGHLDGNLHGEVGRIIAGLGGGKSTIPGGDQIPLALMVLHALLRLGTEVMQGEG